MDVATLGVRDAKVKFPSQMNASGSLYLRRRLSGAANPSIDWSGVRDLEVSPAPVQGWTAMTLASKEPLNNEILQDNTQLFFYHFLLRQGQGDRFLLVANVPELSEVLLQRLGARKYLTTPKIDTAGLTRMLASKPGRYSMSAVYADINGYGNALRSASFFGQDLADALAFVQLLPRLSAFRVSLRDITHRIDVISVGARGQVSFPYKDAGSLRNVDQALLFLTQRGFLDWEADDQGLSERIS